jgi:hypothetical protein
MKHSFHFGLLPCVLIALCPALLGHCGGATQQATETGNPPGVAEQKLHILLRNTGVEVVGDAGAVGAGANVSVTNRSSGDHGEAIAKVDGSFDIVVPGSLQDEYEVTVSQGSATQTVRISANTNGAEHRHQHRPLECILRVARQDAHRTRHGRFRGG